LAGIVTEPPTERNAGRPTVCEPLDPHYLFTRPSTRSPVSTTKVAKYGSRRASATR